MEEKKLDKRQNLEIAALSIIIILLIGICVYLLFIKKDDNKCRDVLDNNEKYITDFTKLPNKSDSNLKEISNMVVYTEFLKDEDLRDKSLLITKSNDDFKFRFRCEYFDSDKNSCSKVSVLIDDLIYIDDFYDFDDMISCSKDYRLIKGNDYYVLIDGDCSAWYEMTIYKNDIKELTILGGNSIEPVIVNNVLYFNRYTGSGLKKSYIDLSQNIIEIVTVK